MWGVPITVRFKALKHELQEHAVNTVGRSIGNRASCAPNPKSSANLKPCTSMPQLQTPKASLYTHMYVYVCTYVYVYIHIYIYIYIHTHTACSSFFYMQLMPRTRPTCRGLGFPTDLPGASYTIQIMRSVSSGRWMYQPEL